MTMKINNCFASASFPLGFVVGLIFSFIASLIFDSINNSTLSSIIILAFDTITSDVVFIVIDSKTPFFKANKLLPKIIPIPNFI